MDNNRLESIRLQCEKARKHLVELQADEDQVFHYILQNQADIKAAIKKCRESDDMDARLLAIAAAAAVHHANKLRVLTDIEIGEMELDVHNGD